MPRMAGAGTITTTDWFGILAKIKPSPGPGVLAHVPTLHSSQRAVTDPRTARMVTEDSCDGTTCGAVRALSFAACDGELSASEFVAIEAHLQRCDPCRTYCISDAVFLGTIRATAKLDTAPPSLHDRIAHNLQPRASENAST